MADDIGLPDGAREEDTERDGFLSYAGEWHALAIGAGVGLAVASTGEMQLLALVVAVALGLNRGRLRLSRDVTFNIRREPWYAFGGVVLGYVIGTIALVAISATPLGGLAVYVHPAQAAAVWAFAPGAASGLLDRMGGS